MTFELPKHPDRKTGDGRPAEREWQATLNESESHYLERRDRLYDRLREPAIQTMLDWSDDLIEDLSATAQEVFLRGGRDELIAPDQPGSGHRRQLFEELLSEAKRRSRPAPPEPDI